MIGSGGRPRRAPVVTKLPSQPRAAVAPTRLRNALVPWPLLDRTYARLTLRSLEFVKWPPACMLRIALGLEHLLNLSGGVSVLVGELIQGISAFYEVVLISPDPAGFKHPGICTHVPWDPANVSRRASKQLAERLASLRVSLAHLHAPGVYGWGWRFPGASPVPFLKQNGIVCVSTIHAVSSLLEGYCGPQKPTWFKFATLPVAWLGKLQALRSLRAEIVVSDEGCRRVRRWFWPMRSRFRCIYHSRLPASLPPVQPAREPLVISVGHVAWRKGQHTLAAAFAKIAAAHPDWKLAIIGPAGSDGCFAQVQEIISAHRMQHRMSLLGSRDDASEFMQRAAIFVQPSVFEGLPLALQEAMFWGCACVATSVPGNNELIEHDRTGLLVPPLHSEALTDALEQLIRQPEKRLALGRAAAAAVVKKGMNAASMIDHHLALYRALCPESPLT